MSPMNWIFLVLCLSLLFHFFENVGCKKQLTNVSNALGFSRSSQRSFKSRGGSHLMSSSSFEWALRFCFLFLLEFTEGTDCVALEVIQPVWKAQNVSSKSDQRQKSNESHCQRIHSSWRLFCWIFAESILEEQLFCCLPPQMKFVGLNLAPWSHLLTPWIFVFAAF